jgi:ribonucleoside-triphosphate reductase
MNEACLNAKWIGEDLIGKNAQKFTKEVINRMRERLSDYQEEYGDLHNLEATPAESTTYRLAKSDVERYDGIITAAKSKKDTPYYTNSSHLPVGYTEDVFAALAIQDEFQSLYTSGTVFHAFLGEKMPSWQSTAALIRKIAENYTLPYYTLSPTYSICKNHGYITGEVKECPQCGEATEVYSRITGYYRPVKNWNDGKSQEFKDRKIYKVDTENLDTNVSTVNLSSEAFDVGVFSEAKKDYTYSNDPNDVLSFISGHDDTEAILFTTKTCPNCSVAKSFLDSYSIMHKIVDAEENRDLARKYKVMQAPTLVVVNGEGVMSYANASSIKEYAETVKH